MNSRHPRTTPAIAPLHRGPQAMSHSGGAAIQHAPNAALLIDFDNVTMGIQKDLHAELRNLLSSDIVKGKVAVQRAYADWRRYPQYIVPLAESSIDMIMAPAYGSSKKNATDIRLAVDAIELVFTRPEIGTYILLSGDSDFASLVTKLKEYGKYVIGVGIRESSSDLLVMNCDEYYSYNALAGLVKTGEEEVVKWDPWELVTEAIKRMVKNGDVMRSDRLKQVMQELDPNFDEKNLGMSKFSRFCQEAAGRGLLALNKLENGQLEVGLPVERAGERAIEAAERPALPGIAPSAVEQNGAREERGGRRGRRGRGRGRGTPPDGMRTDGIRPAAVEGPRSDRPDRVDRGSRGVESAPAATATPPHGDVLAPPPAAPTRAPEREDGDRIGLGGERLTRDEAFGLVRRAVESLTTGDDAVSARDVRRKAFQLLGHDSESLSERNFSRILRDAHDAEQVDLRRRGDDFEVARVAEIAPVSEQLNRAAAATRSATPAPSAPPPPRGMVPRGTGGRGRPGARGAAPPPDLFSIGVVEDLAPPPAPIAEPAPEPAAAPGGKTREPRAKTAAKRPGGRGKRAAKTAAAEAPVAVAEAPARGGRKAAAKTRRPRGKKAAAGDGAGADSGE
jgi:uncharacterized protein (TIGR00288 family)